MSWKSLAIVLVVGGIVLGAGYVYYYGNPAKDLPLIDQANLAYNGFQYDQAASLYAEALAMGGLDEDQRESAMFNRARALEKAHQETKAIVGYRAYLSAFPQGPSAEAASKHLKELELKHR